MPRSVNGRAKVTASRLVRRSIVPLRGARAPHRAAPPRPAGVMLLTRRRAGHRPLQGGQLVGAEPGGTLARVDLVGHGRPATLLDELAAAPAAERLERHELGGTVGHPGGGGPAAPRLEAARAPRPRELVARAERRLLGHGPGGAAGRPPAP